MSARSVAWFGLREAIRMDELQTAVGVVIRRERRERGLTLKDFATRAIISVVYLGEIERGKKYPSPVTLERLAEALDLTTSDLLERIAIELRGVEQPVEASHIGFITPQRVEVSGAPTHAGGRIVNLLAALVA
ncbi:MAG TPA: helix-turn-helix transcriptional regulator [Ktedonobacterales bacterium]|jgi:transcriptional regulator with XRE-family HTH domain